MKKKSGLLRKGRKTIAHGIATGFKPYQAHSHELDIDEYQKVIMSIKRESQFTNEFSYYQGFLDQIRRNSNCTVLKVKNLYDQLPPGKFGIALRHDIDMDPFTALRMSGALFEAGLQGTFYVLHTAGYYGSCSDDVFLRNENLIKMLCSIQHEHHCELGMHIDGLSLYQSFGLNGSQAIKSELDWLREQGMDIQGSSAHNSAPVYGAENFEIFDGRAIFDRFILFRNGKRIPLQTLIEADLGLSYEANHSVVSETRNSLALDSYLEGYPPDPVRNEQWMRTHLLDNPHCIWRADYNIWLIGKDSWVISGHPRRDPVYRWDVNLEEVIDFLSQLPELKRVVCNIHPTYVD